MLKPMLVDLLLGVMLGPQRRKDENKNGSKHVSG